ncbi:MAG: helix-turn-helix domain-containing protein [Ignisphaera sp.]|jgi:predicted DNA binding protein|nr:helix-turn-helix domain-containing protein [Ignisphaera sp.]
MVKLVLSTLLPDQDITFYHIKIRNVKNSFLGKLSELSSSRILVNVYKVPGYDYYFVVALTYGRDVDKFIKQLMINDYYLRKSKIIKIRVQKLNDLHIIYGLKRTCEFYKLAQDNNVHILLPYIFDRGSRDYMVLGNRENVKTYIEHVKQYYGYNNVEYTLIDAIEEFSLTFLKESLLSIVLDKLTPAERKVLKEAFRTGYFEYPKTAGQYEIGSNLGLSKVTISIHLRKAFRKIVKDFIQLIE